MELCCCTAHEDSERLLVLKKLGFKYFEARLCDFENTDPKKVQKAADEINRLGMSCISYNCMFPPHLTLLGGACDYPKIENYLRKVLTNSMPLGGKYIVLGSGTARNIPEGVTKAAASERFISLLRDCIAPIAREFDKIVVIEELRAEETNFINSSREAAELVRKADLPDVKLLVDYYHATLAGETTEDFLTYGDILCHIHIASPIRWRNYPNEEDYNDCREFFRALKRIGYSGVISIEGIPAEPFEETCRTAYSVLKRALEDA